MRHPGLKQQYFAAKGRGNPEEDAQRIATKALLKD
jgi:hypothetical protein